MEANPAVPPEEVEAFEKLFSKESTVALPSDYLQDKGIKLVRQYAVSYIQTLYSCENFDASVPYFAMIYFDRFFSKHDIPPLMCNKQENINLFVVSCLMIAWKMRLKSFDLPKFLLERHLKFGKKGVMRMEMIILTALDWKLRPLTPLSFYGFFIRFLPPMSQNLIRRPALQIIVTTQSDIRITKFRPSTVAASAILCSAAKLFPADHGDFKSSIIQSSASFDTSELQECMEMIEREFDAKLKSLTLEISTGTSQPTTSEASSALSRAEPTQTSEIRAEDEEQQQQGEEPTGESVRHRSGKEPIVEHEEDTIIRIEQVVGEEVAGYEGMLMDFKLEWIESMANSADEEDRIGSCSFIDVVASWWPFPVWQIWEWLQHFMHCFQGPNADRRRRYHYLRTNLFSIDGSLLDDTSFPLLLSQHP